jgi:hypothetical protein
MQKCFKNKIEGFEEWYSNLQEQFKLNSFAKKLVDITVSIVYNAIWLSEVYY